MAASARFLEGFTPAAYAAPTAVHHLHMAFAVEKTWEPVGVCVRQEGDDIVGDIYGEADTASVRAQVERILSLDVDGSGFLDVGRRDPAVARLQAHYPGLRPVLFWSPYEAAAWSIISLRTPMSVAARAKQHIAQELGDAVDFHSERLYALPPPRRIMELESFPGLSTRKVEYLSSVAQAALEGKLDAHRLRSILQSKAIRELQEIHGIGPFSAELILVRGAGDPDFFPTQERRIHQAMAQTYGLGNQPKQEQLLKIAEAWRPYRAWASFLFRRQFEEERRP